jgi:hypothetical protein
MGLFSGIARPVMDSRGREWTGSGYAGATVIFLAVLSKRGERKPFVDSMT